MRVVDHREVVKLLAEGAQLVDVLPEHEYRSVHICGAIHLPLPHLIDRAESALDKNQAVVVYCRDCL